jgi:hypothetical protein
MAVTANLVAAPPITRTLSGVDRAARALTAMPTAPASRKTANPRLVLLGGEV